MASSSLNLLVKALAYNDLPATSNPQRRHFDWGQQHQALGVVNPKSYPYTIPANSSQLIFSGVRATTIDNTTQFTLTSSSLGGGRYRFSATSGTAPTLRADRGLTPNGHTLTWTANTNGTSTLTSSTVAEFLAVQVGDNVWVPGPITGDGSSPFNQLNQGLWVVLSKDGTSTTLQLQRPTGTSYSGASEAVVVTANSQIQAFAAAGVQIGDTVDISAGFAASVQQSYIVVSVTPSWFEVITTGTLPVSQAAIPGVTGIVFYSNAKRFIAVEVDQEAAVQLNGDTTTNNRVSPIVAGDPDKTGFIWKWGTTWALTVVNRSAVPLDIVVLSAE